MPVENPSFPERDKEGMSHNTKENTENYGGGVNKELVKQFKDNMYPNFDDEQI